MVFSSFWKTIFGASLKTGQKARLPYSGLEPHLTTKPIKNTEL